MTQRKKKITSGRIPEFKDRLIELQGEMTQEEFANYTGLSRPTVCFYLNGERIPDAETLKQICERCQVSSDWLLGLSSVRSPGSNVREAAIYTGLSENAIHALHTEHKDPERTIDTLSLFIESSMFHRFSWFLNKAGKGNDAAINKNFAESIPKEYLDYFENTGIVILDAYEMKEHYKMQASEALQRAIDEIRIKNKYEALKKEGK